MKIKVLTLFPNSFNDFLNTSILAKAIQKEQVEISVVDIRDYANGKMKQVDDYQAGGGQGMVLKVDVIYRALQEIKTKNSLVVLLSPQGKTWNQDLAYKWSKTYDEIILICGHYEGFDERVLDYCDVEISIGNYVLTGGEIASMVLIDSITRLLHGVIKEESHINESFNDNLLDYSVYTKPVSFKGKEIPVVLMSGHHQKIEEWRQKSKIKNTFLKRKDLLEKAQLTLQQRTLLDIIKKECKKEEN